MFCEHPRQETITCKEREINLEDDIGVFLVIPKDSIGADEELNLAIRPSFSGPFAMPDGVEPVSPAVLVEPDQKVKLRKNIGVRLQHCSEGEEDGDKDLVFMRASLPQNDKKADANPEYKFTVQKDGVKFARGSGRFGEILTRRLSGWFRIGHKRASGE